MPKLNLEAKNETQKIIKDYLEKNVSDILADKINNGVRIQKDGKTLINKKTLAGCMDFALKEAQKLGFSNAIIPNSFSKDKKQKLITNMSYHEIGNVQRLIARFN